MATVLTNHRSAAQEKSQRGTEEPPFIKWMLIMIALGFSLVFLVLLLVNVFVQALGKGWNFYWVSLKHQDSWAAIRLTLTVAAISVPLNVLFGLAAAWAITKFEFVGKTLLLSLIDLPFSLSPVISGLVWMLLFGANGWFGPQLDALGIKLVFNVV